MRLAFGLLLGLSVAQSTAFLLIMGRPANHEDVGVAWFLTATAWANLSVDAVLLAGVLGAMNGPWAVWLFAASLVLQNVAFTWRNWLALSSRRRTL